MTGSEDQDKIARGCGEQSQDQDPLEEAVHARLEQQGVLGGLRARARAEVARALKGVTGDRQQERQRAGEGSGDNFLVEELLREYLRWNGMTTTAEVLDIETSSLSSSLSREELESCLGLRTGPNARRVPLIYTLLSAVRKQHQHQ